LLLLFAIVANGQTFHSQDQLPLYNEYRGVRLGMAAEEARAKLGVPLMQSDEQVHLLRLFVLLAVRILTILKHLDNRARRLTY